MTYTPTNWQNSPSTSSPIDAANLNNMEAGIVASLKADGSVTSTVAQTVQVTLGGSNRLVADWTATDGKHWQIFLTTGGLLSIYDATDAVTALSIANGMVWVNPQPAYGISPLITFPVGDCDTGIAWIANGSINVMSNNTAVMKISGGNLVNVTATLQNNGQQVASILGGGSKVSVQSTAPSSPAIGDIWIDTSVNLG